MANREWAEMPILHFKLIIHMSDTELREFIKRYRSNFTVLLRAYHHELYNNILDNYKGKTFVEKMYRYLNRDKQNIGKCLVCGNDCSFLKFDIGFRDTCSLKCRGKLCSSKTHDIRRCKLCGKEFTVYIKNKAQYCSNECRVIISRLNSKERCRKSYESNLKNHNGIYSLSLPEHQEKSKLTKFKKYGSETFNNIEKTRITKMRKYGDPYFSNPNKVKETCLKKYGVKNIFLYKKANGIGVSKPQKKLYEIIKEKYSNTVLEYQIPNLGISADIFIPEKNLIVEFYGDYWHCNPEKYDNKYFHKAIHRTAEEIWERDKERELKIRDCGYNFAYIWESDFNKNDFNYLNEILN